MSSSRNSLCKLESYFFNVDREEWVSSEQNSDKDFPAVKRLHSQFVNADSSLEEIDGLSWKVSSFPSKGGTEG